MRVANLAIAAAAIAAAPEIAHAAPERRGGWPTFPHNKIESWINNAWGPQESLSTPADLVLLDHTIVSADQIKRQKRDGKKVVCYISAGNKT